MNKSKKELYVRLEKSLKQLWNAYLEIPACSREEVIELKLLIDIIQNRINEYKRSK